LSDYDLVRYVKPAKKKHKRFGIEEYSGWFGKWYCHRWYETESSRDQALASLMKHTTFLKGTPWETQFRKCTRE
jgi:hypothetical protein